MAREDVPSITAALQGRRKLEAQKHEADQSHESDDRSLVLSHRRDMVERMEDREFRNTYRRHEQELRREECLCFSASFRKLRLQTNLLEALPVIPSWGSQFRQTSHDMSRYHLAHTKKLQKLAQDPSIAFKWLALPSQELPKHHLPQAGASSRLWCPTART